MIRRVRITLADAMALAAIAWSDRSTVVVGAQVVTAVLLQAALVSKW